MTEKYKALDEAIWLAISVEKANSFNTINSGETRRLADAMAKPDRDDGYPESWRLIDRRLQALRKAGRIFYSRAKGWTAP